MSSSITFETTVKVKLDGKHVGDIKEVKTISGLAYQYFPKGSKVGGELYPSLQSCKQSLTGD